MSNALAVYKADLDARRSDYELMLGGDKAKAERLVRFAMNALAQNEYLQSCDRASFLLACSNAALTGLEPEPSLGQVYFVPRKGKVHCQIGYKGFLALAYRAERLVTVKAELVREGDTFDFELGSQRFIKHKPKLPNDGPFIAGYARATFVGGIEEFIVRDIADVNKIRDEHSEAYKRSKGGPWATHFYEMACKTLIRWLLKSLPVGDNLQRAIAIDEEAEHADDPPSAQRTVGDALKAKAKELKPAQAEIVNVPGTGANGQHSAVGSGAPSSGVAVITTPALAPTIPPNADLLAALRECTNGYEKADRRHLLDSWDACVDIAPEQCELAADALSINTEMPSLETAGIGDLRRLLKRVLAECGG